jgi:hypothetical protein
MYLAKRPTHIAALWSLNLLSTQEESQSRALELAERQR